MDLKTLLVWIISGGGSGVLAYALLEELGAALSPKAKRYVAIASTALLGVTGYMLAAWLGYVTAPITTQGWIEVLSPIILTAFGLSQVIHGARQLS